MGFFVPIRSHCRFSFRSHLFFVSLAIIPLKAGIAVTEHNQKALVRGVGLCGSRVSTVQRSRESKAFAMATVVCRRRALRLSSLVSEGESSVVRGPILAWRRLCNENFLHKIVRQEE